MSEVVQVERNAGVATIRMNRPDRLNAYNPEMGKALLSAVSEASIDPSVRCVVLTGEGRAFSAGGDVEFMAAFREEGHGKFLELAILLHALIASLRKAPKPVIAAVNGVAAGAGANVALACDLVIAAKSASFIQAFCRIGLMPDAGGTYFLPRLVGSARALGLSLLGDKLPAEQAAQWGLIWQCVDDAELPAATDKLLAHLAQAPTRALAAIKEALQASAGNSLLAQLDLERDRQRELGRADDYAEGVAAFTAKRPPRFTGR